MEMIFTEYAILMSKLLANYSGFKKWRINYRQWRVNNISFEFKTKIFFNLIWFEKILIKNQRNKKNEKKNKTTIESLCSTTGSAVAL
jgi:hypothetical protein